MAAHLDCIEAARHLTRTTHFVSDFCRQVDPTLLLPDLHIAEEHKEEVTNICKQKHKHAACQKLWEYLQRAVGWPQDLTTALERSGQYNDLLSFIVTALPNHCRRGAGANAADLTLGDVNIIEAEASARRIMCTDQLIQELIRTKGDQITLGWLLNCLKAKGHQNVFTDICIQLHMESLLDDLVDGPPNSNAMGAQRDGDQALIQALWDHLEVPPVAPPQNLLTEAMEEEGGRNGPGLDMVGGEPPSPPPTAHLHPCGSSPPSSVAASASRPSAAARGGDSPGRCSQTRAPAGTRAAQPADLLPAQPGRGRGQGGTAPRAESSHRGRAEEGKADPHAHPHTGMEDGPCPNADMIMAEERHARQENFQPLHHGEGGPYQTTAAGAFARGQSMASRFEDGDPDDVDDKESYEVLLRQGRQNQDGEEQDVTALVRGMEHSSLHNGEQEIENIISHQSAAYPNMVYSGQNAGSGQGGLADAGLDSGLSSSRSIDLRQHRQPPQPQHSVSADSPAGNPLEGIQLRSAVGRASEDSGGVAATACGGYAAPSAFVELSQQHVMNGNADGSIRMLHCQHAEVSYHGMANSGCSVGMPGIFAVPVPSTSDATVALSSRPAPSVLQMSSVDETSAGICSPAGLALSNAAFTTSSSDDSPADPSARNSPPSSLSSPSPLGSPEFGGRPEVPSDPSSSLSCSSPEGTAGEVPILNESQLQEAHALSAFSPLPAVSSDLPHESEVFMSASSSGGNTGGSLIALAETSMDGPEEESRFWSLTESISATLQSMFNSG